MTIQGFAGIGPFPNDAVDPLPAEADTHHYSGLGGFGILLLNVIVEGLPQMDGLNIQHHLGYGMLRSRRFNRGRTLAPLARGEPVKRQLLGILSTHDSRVTQPSMAAFSSSTLLVVSQVKSASLRPK